MQNTAFHLPNENGSPESIESRDNSMLVALSKRASVYDFTIPAGMTASNAVLVDTAHIRTSFLCVGAGDAADLSFEVMEKNQQGNTAYVPGTSKGMLYEAGVVLALSVPAAASVVGTQDLLGLSGLYNGSFFIRVVSSIAPISDRTLQLVVG